LRAAARLKERTYAGREWEADGYLIPCSNTSIGPYVGDIFFDPNSPIRADFGVQLKMDYRPRPGPDLWPVGSGTRWWANIADSFRRVLNSVIEPVRTNARWRYGQRT